MSAQFSAAERAQIIDCRNRGLSWVKVALEIRRRPGDVRRFGQDEISLPVCVFKTLLDTPRAVRDRARTAKQNALAMMPPEMRLGVPDDRQPLPAGHPSTWGAICGSPYPARVAKFGRGAEL